MLNPPVMTGTNIKFAPMLYQFEKEIDSACGLTAWDGMRFNVYSLGRRPSLEHMLRSPNSRHNDMLTPQGDKLTCAHDIGDLPDGKGSIAKVFMFVALKYASGDDRWAPYGFSQRGDGNSLTWQQRFPTIPKQHYTGGDIGHNHNDTNMFDSSFSGGPSSYVPAMRSTMFHGFRAYILTGQIGLGAETVANAFDGLSQQDGQNMYKALANADTRTLFLQTLLDNMTKDRAGEHLATREDLGRLVMFTIDKDPAVWALVGDKRFYISPIAFGQRMATGSMSPVALTSADPWAQLEVGGNGPQPTRYVRFTDAADPSAVYRVCDGVRDKLSWDQYVALKKPPVEVVSTADVAYSAKFVGNAK